MANSDCCTDSKQLIQEARIRLFANTEQMAAKASAEIRAMAERNRRSLGQKVRWQLDSLK